MPARTLVVDDDPTNRIVLEQALSALGHDIVAAADGASALRILAFETVDLLLLDLHMPRQSGLDVLRELRAFEGPNRFVPAICISADIVSRKSFEYLDLGFHSFLAKPVRIAKLAVAVNEALSTSLEQLRRDRLSARLASIRAPKDPAAA